ncbi:MAG: phosphatase PAP2 family protein [Eubacteriales bacterium]|nr:phosphatase PAP2 family protein [Eubacteriales bacterium]
MKNKERIALLLILIALMTVFTFTDLAISTALYTKNLFARIMEVVGELPFTFFAVFAWVLLFRSRSKKSKAASILTGALFGVLSALFAAMGGFMTYNYLHEQNAGVPPWIAAVIALALLGAAIYAARRVPGEKSRRAAKFAWTAIVYFIAVIVVMNVTKGVWSRLRMREMTDPLVQFTRWYVITPHSGFDNAYASFPSGHAMNAAGSILLCLLPTFLPGFAGKERILKGIVLLWVLAVCVSRVMMGAHFASDVTMGVLLSLLLFEAIRGIVYRKGGKLEEAA